MLKVKQSKVVLPADILEAEGQSNFAEKVQAYMKRYDGYKVIAVENGLAICEVFERRETSGNQNKKGHHQRRTSGANG
ncbi:hypothetical protein [Niallia nealsonii]|uniref:hypothetical protein n=1 Tax=Niallia nealsonii TaxID=115979 RepID=UPI0012FF3717|nr:hypothetical protein [Niallia nealsonii]